jgi:hypothetical protein
VFVDLFQNYKNMCQDHYYKEYNFWNLKRNIDFWSI